MTEAKNGRGKPRDLLKRFGPYLQERRKAKQLTLREFARLAKCAHSNVFQFEQEKKDPRLTELAALARAFGERLDKFVKPIL